ncbi:MAG TPA: nuclear transport factor 2 family protein [Phototrophicaceae bacterium]|nr:nuclear transport factor 2 family protein [Phototrophicaceae bacterium]
MSQNLEQGKYRDLYYRQLGFLAENDPEGLIHTQYTEDAELLNFDHYVRGAPALIEYFKHYIHSLGYIKLISTDKYIEGDEQLMFEATVETAAGIARVYDVFVLRGDKIWRHFAGLLSFTAKAAAGS